jgi:hypothetical protein
MARETGWLIEQPGPPQPMWLEAFRLEDAQPFLLSPTAKAQDALRFSRKIDAQIFLHNLVALHPHWRSAGLIITDHEWMER